MRAPSSFAGTTKQRAPMRSVHAQASAGTSLFREIHRQITSKERTAQDIARQYLDILRAREDRVKAFISYDEAAAMAQAAAVDAKVAAGEPLGLLAGIPIAVKDNICTRGLQTTAASRALEGYHPPYDATVCERLRAAGAVFVGKTNMDEFGMGSSTENSAYHVTRNPWDLDRVPGGSSGGSAAAVAAGECAAALGSDTGGSIRQPASFCGVVGIKPTYGLVSRYGLISYASSLDCIGPLAATVEDAALLLGAMAGPDPRDATTAAHEATGGVERYVGGLKTAAEMGDKPLKGKRIAVIRETTGQGVDPGVSAVLAATIKRLESLGAAVTDTSLPTFDAGLPAYYVIALSEASSNLARYDGVRYGPRADAADIRAMYNGTRGQYLGPEVKRRILMGTYALSAGYYDAYYKRAQQVRTLIQREMLGALEGADALLCPAAPTPAYKLGEKTTDPLAMYKGDLMTVNLNLAGLPAVTVPCGTAEIGGKKMPVGLQLIGRAFGEAGLVELAHVLEQTGDRGAAPAF